MHRPFVHRRQQVPDPVLVTPQTFLTGQRRNVHDSAQPDSSRPSVKQKRAPFWASTCTNDACVVHGTGPMGFENEMRQLGPLPRTMLHAVVPHEPAAAAVAAASKVTRIVTTATRRCRIVTVGRAGRKERKTGVR